MAAINNFGNGTGYLYCTNIANSAVIAVYQNTANGARKMRNLASVTAPVAANRSAFAIIQVDTAGATGALTTLSVDGVNQIAANVTCASSDTAVVAATWAAAVNAFTPSSGFNFTAFAIGDLVYLVAPAAAGSAANGLAIVVSTNTGTLTATVTQQLINGSDNTGVYDQNLGQRFWLNPNGDAAPDAATPITTPAEEITKYITDRGLQIGTPTIQEVLSNDRMSTDRYSAITTYVCDTEGGAASDYMVFINPTDFVESDIILIRGASAARPITIVSAPNAGGVSSTPNPNIYLNGNANYVTGDSTSTIFLQYKNDPTLGGIFSEVGRSGQPTVQADMHAASGTSGFVENKIDWEYTYAQLAVIKAASGLFKGMRYRITDKGGAGIIVTADQVNNFSLAAVYVASYSGTLYDEYCIYNFAADRVVTRLDKNNNFVSDTTGAFNTLSTFPFGNAAYTNNIVIDCTLSLSTTATLVNGNIFKYTTVTIGTTRTVALCQTIIGGTLNIIAGSGIVQNLQIYDAATVTIGSLAVVKNVQIYDEPTVITINGTMNYATIRYSTFTLPAGTTMSGSYTFITSSDLSLYTGLDRGEYVRGQYSSLTTQVDMSGAATYTDTDIDSCGIIEVDVSAGPTVAIDEINVGAIRTPVRIQPSGSQVITINDSTVASGNFVLKNGFRRLTLNGLMGQYAIFTWLDSSGLWIYQSSVPSISLVKQYMANITQASTAAPVVNGVSASTPGSNQYEQNYIGSPVFARTTTGVFTITLANAFPADVTIPTFNLNFHAVGTEAWVKIVRTSDSVLTLSVYNDAGTLTDGFNGTINISVNQAT